MAEDQEVRCIALWECGVRWRIQLQFLMAKRLVQKTIPHLYRHIHLDGEAARKQDGGKLAYYLVSDMMATRFNFLWGWVVATVTSARPAVLDVSVWIGWVFSAGLC